ncbi:MULTISPECIES: CocE/NonD family hydrolase [Roseobacteraceae]|uniref:CocE/NonD family hydrolase n=1 Tax=Roseobacteraceae TaxID=2854170 RepID=UPI001C43B456|nr:MULTISPECIES: CocE/NonD family hydrolase [Roseobacteraceae]MBV7409003.1 CocE/NonD family hydrolase [Maritimibacter sp. DP1N21-5]MBY5934310.1 CocE/NonD family hydrolase [Tateyamaria omphalii]
MQNTLREIEEQPDLGITLSDGTRLSVRMWRPVDAAVDPVPVILEYLPYRKRDGTCARDALTHPYFAQRGYACLRVDMRGDGDSHGLMQDEYTQQELDDAVEVITWAAAQPWCNGNVGMMGISWGGFNSLQVAALAPEPLKAIITLCSTVDRFADDIHFKGGCLLNENLGWGATMWSYSSRAPDPALRPDWREMWLERLENEPFLPSVWLRHQSRDDYWKHGSVCESYDTIKAKVLAIGGWGDSYKNAVPQVVENIPGAKGILGPWVHKYPHFAVPEPRIGFLQEALRWWDRWLKGTDTGVEDDPALRSYLMDGVRPATWYTNRPGRWLADAQSEERTWFLTDNGLEPDQGSLHRAVASPQDTGTDAGEYCAIWLGPELPGDQRRDDALSACFDSAPLDSDLSITGAPVIRLTLSADQPVAHIAVRLNHVHPDGASTRITYGVLNLAKHLGRPLAPGQQETIRLPLDHIAYTVPAGHRIRVAISTAYWPLIWPAPEAATVTLHGGSISIDSLTTAGDWTFPPPDAAPPWQTEELRPETHTRRQETDMVTGITSLVIEDDFGKLRDLDHGLITGSIARERWDIHPDDPLSARGTCHWTDELERDGTRLRTEARCAMWSDATHFHLSASMEAFENDTRIYHQEITDKIARDLL